MSLLVALFSPSPLLREALHDVLRMRIVSAPMLATKLGLQFQQADGLLKQLAEYQMIVPTGWPDASIPLYNVSPHGYEVAEELQLVNRLRFGFRNG